MKVFQSAPHPALNDYIAQYIFLSLDNAAEFGSLEQFFFPIDICGLALFSEKLRVRHSLTAVDCNVPSVYTGLTTASCSLTFPANCQVEGFIIVFKPTGFTDLFRIDNSDVTNYFPDFFSIRGQEGKLFYDQIMEATEVLDKMKLADAYFIKKIPRRDKSLPLREACEQIIRNDGLLNINTLASKVNMSISSLERNFRRSVGVSPKLFARFKRFHHALLLANGRNAQSLTDIAYQSGYYDQAHFIKEVEGFTNCTPSSLSLQDFPLYTQLILNRNYYTCKK